jgi:lipopolysaccharide/colanic/teichoic acid biosynthesis glycosyltransferase
MTTEILNQEKLDTVHIRIAYMGTELNGVLLSELSDFFTINYKKNYEQLSNYLDDQSLLTLPDVMLLEADRRGNCFNFIRKIKQHPLLQGLIIILLSSEKNDEFRLKALALRVHDFYVYPFPIGHLIERLNFLVKFKLIKPQLEELQEVDVAYTLPLSKRLFDILASSAALVLLSPLFLLIAVLIRLDSKGGVIYKSKRVGTGYRIFHFYKFRSMQENAEKQLSELAPFNKYLQTADVEKDENLVFIKISKDPRVTRLGRFIRNTSIDELPQLFNVLRGDISLVGNRPLPLYEAEQLTSNEWAMRFAGPAGVTGLWQISKRSDKVISARERKKMDNFYALNYSFWFDLKILLKTFPALFQKEKA